MRASVSARVSRVRSASAPALRSHSAVRRSGQNSETGFYRPTFCFVQLNESDRDLELVILFGGFGRTQQASISASAAR